MQHDPKSCCFPKECLQNKYKLLDLFCGAGGASVGLARAGFEVTGVDIKPQPNYPFEFILGDALTMPLDGYDAYWASPPCQAYAYLTKHRCPNSPKLIAPIRERLVATGKPYIIENVASSPLKSPFMLCGAMFGLKVIRHRYFEANFLLLVPVHQNHKGSPKNGKYITVAGHGGNSKSYKLRDWQKAIDIDWMTKNELTEAVPPIYAEFLGKQLIEYIESLKLSSPLLKYQPGQLEPAGFLFASPVRGRGYHIPTDDAKEPPLVMLLVRALTTLPENLEEVMP